MAIFLGGPKWDFSDFTMHFWGFGFPGVSRGTGRFQSMRQSTEQALRGRPRDTRQYHTISCRDNIAERILHPFFSTFTWCRASIAGIPLLQKGEYDALSLNDYGQGYRTQSLHFDREEKFVYQDQLPPKNVHVGKITGRSYIACLEDKLDIFESPVTVTPQQEVSKTLNSSKIP